MKARTKVHYSGPTLDLGFLGAPKWKKWAKREEKKVGMSISGSLLFSLAEYQSVDDFTHIQ